MKAVILLLTSLFAFNASADLSTAFLVVRVDIEQELIAIDAHSTNPENSLNALQSSLAKLESFKNEVFAPALAARENEQPLNGLTLTRIHSYLKIHLTILERGLALVDALEEQESLVDDRALAMMSLSLLHHFDTYLEDDHLRRLLSKKDEAYDLKAKALKKAYTRLTNKKVQKHIKRMMKDEVLNPSEIAAHEAYADMWKPARKAFRGDFWSRFKSFVVHHISGGVGNSAGSVKFRKGTMWQDFELEAQVQAMLEPMDIITEKTPFILTDRLIPGHFGHNALWLGTPSQLKALGIWDAPYMKPFQAAIEEGYTIIETSRAGTQLKKLSTWMNIDEIAIIRREDRATTPVAINEFYAVLMAQHGKTYDFNFDVETTDKLVCSELLYQTYGDVIWPTEAYLGRFTISPDNVAEIIAQKNTPFKLLFSMERDEDQIEIFKNTAELTAQLGYALNGIDEDGQEILEKESLTCIERVVEGGKKVKTCIKTWLRPVFGGRTLRRFEF
ncbi:MAG: hypothetical protein CME71_05760 [Halobacteriovorax sp.]|nr:hypothetical protein [Halobacteriovorax sp.]